MKKLMGYKLLYAKELEDAIVGVDPKIRELIENLWRTPLPHEKNFHSQSAWVEGDKEP